MTDIFLKIAGMSATASAVIAVIILLRFILKKAPKIFSYLLWAAALFRLLCPFSFELPKAPVEPVSLETEYRTEYINEPNTFETESAVEIYDNAEIVIYTSENDDAPVYKKAKKTVDYAAYIWLAGVSCMALWGIISFLRLKKTVRGAEAKEGVYYSDRISNPFIIGIFRPKIYLPEGIDSTSGELIVLHEKAHIRRGDHIAKIIMYIALCVHWFNPLVWVMFRLFERDMEMSCDEKVTSKMTQENRADYSQALLNISSKRAAAFTACFGESGTKQRVKNVLSFKKPAVWVIIILAAAVAVTAVILTANRAKNSIDLKKDLIISENTTVYIGRTIPLKYVDSGITVPEKRKAAYSKRVEALIDSIVSAKMTAVKNNLSYEKITRQIEIIAEEENSGGIRVRLSSHEQQDGNEIYTLSAAKLSLSWSSDGYTEIYDPFGTKYWQIPKEDYERILIYAERLLAEEPPILTVFDTGAQSGKEFNIAFSGMSWKYTEENGEIGELCTEPAYLAIGAKNAAELDDISGFLEFNFGPSPDGFPDMIKLTKYNKNGEEIQSFERYPNSPEADGSYIDPRQKCTFSVERGMLYSLTAEWNGDKLSERGFSGTGTYYFRTGLNVRDMQSEKFYDTPQSEDEIPEDDYTEYPEVVAEEDEHDYARFEPINDPPLGAANKNWGITLEIESVSPTGAVVVISKNGGSEPAGEYFARERFTVEKRAAGGWEELPSSRSTVPEDLTKSTRVWDDIAYPIKEGKPLRFDSDWEQIYGTLPAGTYRICHEITTGSGTTLTRRKYYAEFMISEAGQNDGYKAYEYEAVLYHNDDRAGYLTLSFELPSEWDYRGYSTAERDIYKMFEIGKCHFVSDGYEFPEAADGTYIENALGRTVTILGTDTNGEFYDYMLHESVPDYYSENHVYETYTYTIRRGDYYIDVSFVVNSYYDEAVCEHILRSFKVKNAAVYTPKQKSIVLVMEYSNYAWGYQHRVTVIDSEGGVYGFDLSDREAYGGKELSELLSELMKDPPEPEIADDPEFIALLKEAAALADKIDPNADMTEEHSAYDAGQNTLYAVTSDGQLRKIVSQGDYTRESTDENAKAIAEICRKIGMIQ